MAKKTLFFLPENLYASKAVLAALYPVLDGRFRIYCIDVSVAERMGEQGEEAYKQHQRDIEAMGAEFIKLEPTPQQRKKAAYDKLGLLGKRLEGLITGRLHRLTKELKPDVVLTTRNYKNFVIRFYTCFKGIPVCSLPHSGFEVYGLEYKLKKVPLKRSLSQSLKHAIAYPLFRYPHRFGDVSQFLLLSWSEHQQHLDLVTYHVGAGYQRKHLGNPRFDPYLKERQAIQEENLSRKPGQTLHIAYCTQPLEKVSGFSSAEKKDAYNESIRKAIESNPDVRMTVVVHPRDSVAYYEEAFQDLGNVSVEMTKLDVLGLRSYGVVIAGWSTVLMECLMAGIPCLTFNPDQLFDFSRFKYLLTGVPLMESGAELSAMLNDYDNWLEQYYSDIEERIKNINTLTTADSSKSIGQLLSELAESGSLKS